MDFPHLHVGNQSAEFLSEFLKKLPCFLADVIFHCLKLETMPSPTLDGSLFLTLQLLCTIVIEKREYFHTCHIFFCSQMMRYHTCKLNFHHTELMIYHRSLLK